MGNRRIVEKVLVKEGLAQMGIEGLKRLREEVKNNPKQILLDGRIAEFPIGGGKVRY